MDRLYDASAFFNILLRETQRGHLTGQAVLDLTQYEIGNAACKNSDKGEANMLKLLDTYTDLIKNMYVISVSKMELKVATMGMTTKATFYDSAYVVVAKEYGLAIVTDDGGMSAVARDHGIETLASSEV